MKKLLLTALALALMLGSFSGAFAKSIRLITTEPPENLQEVYNPEPTFYVRVNVDRDDRIYREGETIKITVNSGKDGYLYVFNEDVNGNITLLFPNAYHSDNKIKRLENVQVPISEETDFVLRVSSPTGTEYIQAVVTSEPLDTITSKSLGKNFTPMDFPWFKKMHEEIKTKVVLVDAPTEKGGNTDALEWAENTVKIKTIGKDKPREIHTSERYFIGIAIDSYKDSNIPGLPACKKDLERVKEMFINNCQVPEDHVFTLIDEEATFDAIHELFTKKIPQMTQSGDIVFVYWSGHGCQIADQKEGDEADGFDECLIAYDSFKFEKETLLIDDEFGNWVQRLDMREVLFVIDACNSGGMGTVSKGIDQESDPDTFDFGIDEVVKLKDIGQKDLALVTSCSSSEKAISLEDRSLMTDELLKILESKRGISHKELAEQLIVNVPKRVEEIKKVKKLPKGDGRYSQKVFFQDEIKNPLILNP